MKTDIVDWAEQVGRFNEEVVGLRAPAEPTPLRRERMLMRVGHVIEEMQEAKDSSTVQDQADAFIDAIYVALGALFEMGVCPGPNFAEVHGKNMQKRRGSVAKRPGSEGFDAVKPEGWTPPEFLSVSLQDYKLMSELSPVLRRITELRAAKGKDYNSAVKLTDYFPFGHQSYVQMIFLKALRLVSLVEVTRTGGRVNFEGTEDTVLDLLNYAVFYGEWLLEQKGK
jgi:hypothetical protein